MSEPQNTAEWEAWQKAMRDYDACACVKCIGPRGGSVDECEKWIAYTKARDAYMKAKKDAL